MASLLVDDYAKRFFDAVRYLEERLEDSLAFYAFPEIDRNKISSTNGVERLNWDIRRHRRVIRVFPSPESQVRMVNCYLNEYFEDWDTERDYICEDKVFGSPELVMPHVADDGP